MKARLYVRVAKKPTWSAGTNLRIAAGPKRIDMPLETGDRRLRTLHFAVDLVIPDDLFADPAMPVVEVQVNPDGTFATDPVVVQVPVDVPERPAPDPLKVVE